MKKLFSFLLILSFPFLISNFASAQKEANIWCFGSGAGIDFNSGSPVFFPGVAMNQWEGVSSIADANGQLLFYTDGITAWNRNNTPMPNGFGLMGTSSSTQSALIVKQPGANPNYYLFTVSETGSLNGFNYSVVDTTLQGGLGDITLKNIFVSGSNDERLTACRHVNGIDVWIVISTNYGDNIAAYLLTATGFSTTPVISNNGIVHNATSNDQIGYMKISPSGNHLAMAFYETLGRYELYDFDNSTGMAANPAVMDSTVYANAYGLEFSPDGTRLYGASHGAGYLVYQFDVTAGSASAIRNSATLVATASHGYAAELQLAPDGKIYISQWTSNVLGAFNDPNALGLASNYNDNAFTLPSGTTNGGLPNLCSGIFFQSVPIALFSALHHICPGTCTNFTNLSINGTTYQWAFAGANPSVSTDANPSNICYNTPGNYSVQLIATNVNGSDTLTLNNYINVYPFPAPQGIAQDGDTLFANAGAVSYQWYHTGVLIPGATDYFYVASQGGDFNVVATDANGCEVEAAIFDVVASVQSTVGNMQLAIYPNPVSDKCTIQNAQCMMGKAVTITIYNMLGVIVQSKIKNQKSEMSVDVSVLSPGLYWLEVSSGETIYRTKFVKQ